MKRLNFINVFSSIFRTKTSFSLLGFLMYLFLVSCEGNALKTGYIDINQINKEFKLALEIESQINSLEKNLTLKLIKTKKKLDALETEIKLLKEKKMIVSQDLLQKFFEIQQNYASKKGEIQKVISDSIEIYQNKLNAQINLHVYEYALKNSFDYVYSPAGTGTFMYADSNLNITKEVIYYLNSR